MAQSWTPSWTPGENALDANTTGTTDGLFPDGNEVVNASFTGNSSLNTDWARQGFLMKMPPGHFVSYLDGPTIVLLSLVCVLGLGNWLVLYTFVREPKLRGAFNVIVIFMTISDGLMSTVRAPLALYYVASQMRPSSATWCFCTHFLGGWAVVNTLMLICVTSLVRLVIGIRTTPIRLTYRTVAVILAVEIALSITVTAVNTQPHSTLILRCQGYIVARIQNTNPSWRFYSSLSLFLLAVTFLCYLTLALVLKINRKGKKETKYTILTAKVAVVKSVLFGVCFLFPYFPLLVDIPVPLRHSRNLVSLFSAVMFLHGGLNPLVYIWTSKIFREAFRRTLPKWVRKHLASQITGPNQVTSAVFTVPTTRNSLRERSS